jgi:CheY-like chemotaxis protein
MKLNTLIVDDDNMVVFLHKLAVVESGLSDAPAIAGNGSQALSYISTNQTPGNYFLVLLDINMPEMDGWGFLDAIQTSDLTTPISVVMVTSSVDTRDRNRASEYAQVIGYIEKPLNSASCEALKKLPQLVDLFKKP